PSPNAASPPPCGCSRDTTTAISSSRASSKTTWASMPRRSGHEPDRGHRLMPPGAVIFDIGRVLIHWDPHGFYDRVIGPEARAQLFAEVDLEGMNERIDNGAPWRETVYATAEAHPHRAAEIRLWHDRWIE